MGRMFDALKSAETTRNRPLSGTQATVAEVAAGRSAIPLVRPATPGCGLASAPTFPSESEEEEERDRPFIEVGPHRSLEGSADVLASPAPSSAHRSATFREVPIAARSRIAAGVVAFHQPANPISAQYRDLLSAVQGALPSLGPVALPFSGAKVGAGTTTVVLNLAVSAARPGRRRVLVVDGNGRRSVLAARLGLEEAPGLAEVLAGTCPLEKALRSTEQTDLFALPAGLSGGTGPLRFQAETIGSLLRRLRQQFDLVFVDGPVWNGQPEVTSPGRACDAVFLVTAAADAGSPLLDDLFRAVPEQGARLTGCIVAGR